MPRRYAADSESTNGAWVRSVPARRNKANRIINARITCLFSMPSRRNWEFVWKIGCSKLSAYPSSLFGEIQGAREWMPIGIAE